MGLPMLPDELLLTLAEQWPCRDTQLRSLDALLSPSSPRPRTLIVYGPRATGKSSVVKTYLETKRLKHAIVQCRECVTGRHLLEKTVGAVYETLRDEADDANIPMRPARSENLSALVVHLQRMLEKQPELILVFDGLDKQRDAPSTLLPALARLGEFIPTLTVLLIVQHPPARFLHQTGIPHIHFSPYTRKQSLCILSRQARDIFPAANANYNETTHQEDKAWLWPRFCAAVWDSLAENAARDLNAFHSLCDKLWQTFITPVVVGEFGTRDFSRLLVHQRRLFQDDSILLDSIIATPNTEKATATARQHDHLLPYYAKWLLLAAYLASFNPVKTDAIYFMKSHERARRKKGGGTAKPRGRGRPNQTRKVQRHLLPPAQFTVDRLLAILHAILPHEFRSTVDIYAQIATLKALRLLVTSGVGGGGDALEPGGKWRVGGQVTWEYVLGLGRSVRFEVGDYVAE